MSEIPKTSEAQQIFFEDEKTLREELGNKKPRIRPEDEAVMNLYTKPENKGKVPKK